MDRAAVQGEMKRIRVLDGLVASKIAAGEVIERPASVVKELLENSLDAGAASISLVFEKGGRELIRVQDNGCGIRAEDAALVVLRHATSKIEEEEDLLRVSTLGFRGEAMASIAAVSRLTITTRARGEEAGVRIRAGGGAEPIITPVGCSEGTTVVVEDLFFNTPVRLKFLRSAQTEGGRITEVFRALALVNPSIRFSLERERGRGIHLPPSGLRERFVSVLGESAPEELIEVTSPHIEGIIGGPGASEASPKYIYAYLNGRPIRDRVVMRALADGYGRLIERPRYPVALLNLRIPPSDVDVNIHPAKTEVRFRNPGAVYSLVRGAVQKALGARLGGRDDASGRGAYGPWDEAREGGSTPVTGVAREQGPGYGAPPGQGPQIGHARQQGGARHFEIRGEDGAGAERGAGHVGGGLFGQVRDREIRNPEFLGLRICGQVWDEFLLAQSPDDGENGGVFYIIDQHGAEERGAYERLRKDFYAGGIKTQLLLMPERIETSADETEALASASEGLARLGFDLAPFGASPEGGETFILKSVPYILPGRGAGSLIKVLAEEICREGGSAKIEERIDRALMTIACHSVIRGPRRLSVEEGEELLKNLARMDFAGYCPHGRPVVKRLTRREVEAFFRR